MLHFRGGEREVELLVISNICSSLQGACGTIDIIGKCTSLDFPLLQFWGTGIKCGYPAVCGRFAYIIFVRERET